MDAKEVFRVQLEEDEEPLWCKCCLDAGSPDLHRLRVDEEGAPAGGNVFRGEDGVSGESTEDTVKLGDSADVVVDSSTEELLAVRGDRELLDDQTFLREWTWETMDSSRSLQEGSRFFFDDDRLVVVVVKI